MATSTLRALILAAAVVVGVVLLSKAFTSSAGQAFGPGGAAAVSPSPSTSPSASPSTSPPRKKNLIKGVAIQVLNGTGGRVAALAATQATRLKHAGYVVCAACVGDTAPGVVYQTTTIFYAKGAKAYAEAMKQRFYPHAVIKPKPASITAKVKLTLVLGLDQAATSPSPSASG